MKTLQELYAEIIGNDELKKAYLEAAKGGKIAEFMKANGCDATAEEIKAFLKEKANQELSEEELDNVAGGGCDKPNYDQNLEIGLSIATAGIGCAAVAAASALGGYTGQKDKDDNYICNMG